MPLVGFLLGSLTDLSLSLSPLGEFLEGREQGYFSPWQSEPGFWGTERAALGKGAGQAAALHQVRPRVALPWTCAVGPGTMLRRPSLITAGWMVFSDPGCPKPCQPSHLPPHPPR